MINVRIIVFLITEALSESSRPLEDNVVRIHMVLYEVPTLKRGYCDMVVKVQRWSIAQPNSMLYLHYV